jgi:hypothetical protein
MTKEIHSELIRCPCCGNQTLGETGNYEICEVCNWEDDPLQRGDPDYEGGANEVSLKQTRQNFLEFGYCDERALERKVVSEKRSKYFNQ